MVSYRALKAVREQRGLRLEAVASTASISLKRLANFEAGEKAPSRKQAEKLSEIYGVPLYSLLSNGIPNLPPLPQDFRKPNPTTAHLSPKAMRVLWASENRAQFALQLIREVGYGRPNLFSPLLGNAASRQQADHLRSTFDEWFAKKEAALQFVGQSEQRFFSGLRLFFEAQGNVLNANDAPHDDYFGFYVRPEAGVPTIFINRSIQSKKAQLFTLVHEIAHWLIGADGISDPYIIANNIERSCNSFAAEFLAPMNQFRRVVEVLPKSTRDDLFQFVSVVSAASLLSRHATAIRLAESGYITAPQLRLWEAARAHAPRREKEEELAENGQTGGHPHAKRISEVGVLPVYLAAKAIDEKIIDKFDTAAGIGLAISLQKKAFDLAKRRIEIARA